jgi:hypothetical protein
MPWSDACQVPEDHSENLLDELNGFRCLNTVNEDNNVTLIISTVFPDAAILLTDGAVVDQVGNLVRVQSKVFRSQSGYFAVAGAGQLDAIEVVASSLCNAADAFGVVGAIGNLQSIVDGVHAETGDHFDDKASKVFGEFVVSAFVPGRGGLHRFFSTVEKGSAPADASDRRIHAPWVVHTLREPVFGRCPSHKEMKEAGIRPLNLDERPADWLREVGADIVEIERRKKMLTVNGEHCVIGGCLDLTVIDEHGFHIERLRTYADVIGRPIDPFKVAPVGMNRHQRRAARAAA